VPDVPQTSCLSPVSFPFQQMRLHAKKDKTWVDSVHLCLPLLFRFRVRASCQTSALNLPIRYSARVPSLPLDEVGFCGHMSKGKSKQIRSVSDIVPPILILTDGHLGCIFLITSLIHRRYGQRTIHLSAAWRLIVRPFFVSDGGNCDGIDSLNPFPRRYGKL